MRSTASPKLSYRTLNRRLAQINFLRAVEEYASDAIFELREIGLGQMDPCEELKKVRSWANRRGFLDLHGRYLWVTNCAQLTVCAWSTEQYRGTDKEWLCCCDPPQPGRWATVGGRIPVGAELSEQEIAQYSANGVRFPRLEDIDFIPLSYELDDDGALGLAGPDGSARIEVEDGYDTRIDLGHAHYDPRRESRDAAMERILKTLDDFLTRRMSEIEVEAERCWRLEHSKKFTVEQFRVLVHQIVLGQSVEEIVHKLNLEKSTVDQSLKDARNALGISRAVGRPKNRKDSSPRRRVTSSASRKS